MNREIITYGTYFKDFLSNLTMKEKEKIDYVLDLLVAEHRLSTNFVKYIRNGLYELRIKSENNNYRIFFCFDGQKIVVLFSAFKKKTQKTPLKEIDRAYKLMKEYYGSKE